MEAKEAKELFEAAKLNDVATVERLLRVGVSVNCGEGKQSPIHVAAAHGSIEALKLLIEANADVYAEDDHNSSPLHLAIEADHLDTVDLLIRTGFLWLGSEGVSNPCLIYIMDRQHMLEHRQEAVIFGPALPLLKKLKVDLEKLPEGNFTCMKADPKRDLPIRFVGANINAMPLRALIMAAISASPLASKVKFQVRRAQAIT